MKKLKLLLLLLLFSLSSYGQCPADHVDIVINVETDNYPSETYWMVFAHQYPGISAGDTIAQVSAGYYSTNNTHHYDTICLPPMLNYVVLIRDTYGDGLLTGGINVIECGTDTSWSYGPASFTGQYTTQGWPDCGPGLTLGCTDSTAQNWNPTAVLDDGSCTYPSGCTDTNATNYDSLAIVDDGSCTYPPCGGFLSSNAYQMCWGSQTAISFEWESDNNSGCDVIKLHYGDETGFSQNFPGYWPANNGWSNFAVMAGNGQMPPNWSLEHYMVLEYIDSSLSDTIFFTPTSCIEGCMDSTQTAYNPWATVDDGSCAGTTCDPATEYQITMTIKLDNWPGETSWNMVTNTTAGNIDMPAGTYNFNDVGQTYTYDFCVSSTAGFEMIINDQFGDGLVGNGIPGNEGEVVIYDCNGDTITYLSSGSWVDGYGGTVGVDFGNVAYSGIQNGIACAGPPVIAGCLDPAYQEFNSFATISDTSCTNLHVFGCNDSTSFNYDPLATQMDIVDTCNYTLTIEDGAADGWGNSYVGVTQGTNTWTYTMGPGSYSQSFPLTLDTDKPITVYYFEVPGAQQSPQAMEFQTMQNSFILENADDVVLLDEGSNPFANNGQGALQGFGAPFWTTYSAMPYCGDYCIPTILGCTDPLAFNYLDTANTDDGNCIPVILGCTNPLAFNYDSIANTDDGNCIAEVTGCMDSTAFNFNPLANNNDPLSCIPVIPGCMDDTMFNYNAAANTDDGSCIPVVFGCTDLIAFNYDSTANTNNGSCVPVVNGCTDPFAYNFDLIANTNDSSCVPYIYGCTDASMFNYDATANTDNGTCIPIINGCTDITMWNYNILANTDNGSCLPYVFGCTDSLAYNFNPLANTDNNACIPVLLGCTDSLAINYNALANTNDNSCIAAILGCTDSSATNYNILANTDDGTCIATVYGCTDSTQYNYNVLANTNDGSCIPYVYGCTDPTMFNYNINANANDGSCIPFVYGCTDNTMFNYDAAANTDNGSCVPFVYGCTDSTMFNYDATANTDNGSCIAFVYGCNDATAFNYDPLANTSDNSCCYISGCMDATALNYDPNACYEPVNSCITIITGCTDVAAYNYNPAANVSDTLACLYDAGCYGGPGNPYWLNDGCYAWVIDVDDYCCTTDWDASCQSMYDYCQLGWPTAIEDISALGIVVYPNPTKDVITIETRLEIQVELYDMIGNKVISESNVRRLDLSKLSNGIYNMSILYNNVRFSKKVIKQ